MGEEEVARLLCRTAPASLLLGAAAMRSLQAWQARL